MPLLWLSAAFASGTLAGLLLPVPWESAAAFAGAALATLGLAHLRRWPLLPFLALVFIGLGFLRVGVAAPGSSPLALYQGSTPLVRGLVASDPEPAGAALRFRLDIREIADGEAWHPVNDSALVTTQAAPRLIPGREPPLLRYGDLLTLEGALRPPPTLEDFDYAAYLARQGISSVIDYPRLLSLDPGHGNPLRQGILALRLRLSDALARAVPEPQSSVDRAVLLGLRRDLPSALLDAFRRTGASHLLAVSGLHVGIVLGILLVAAQALLGRRHGLYILLPLAGIWLYAALTGMAPPVLRAAVMGSLYLWALYLGRPASALPALGFAAAAMLAFQPALLWSVSFQLSFAAVAGLALLGPPIQAALDRLWHNPDTGHRSLATALKGLIAVSLAAILATLPLVAFHFHQVPLLGLPVSVLTVPVMPLILVTSLAAALAFLLFPPLGQVLGWMAWLATAYLTRVVEAFAQLPAVIETGQTAWVLVVAYYLLLLAVLWVARRRGRAPPRPMPSRSRTRVDSIPSLRWGIVALVPTTALVWAAALATPGPHLQVTILDVGQGDAILVEAPNGQQALIDGGPRPLSAVRHLGERLPFWDRSLDLVVLTHPDADHVTGLVEVLRRYRVGTALVTPAIRDTPAYQLWQRALGDSDARVVAASAGQVLWLGNARLQVLNPPTPPWRGTGSDANANSIVLHLSYGRMDFLFTGDLSGTGERFLLARRGVAPVEVLKVAHHGSATSTSRPFLRAIAPALAVVSAGEDNPHGHPDPTVMARLTRALPPGQVLTTADRGSATLHTDGKRLWFSPQRP